jgi:hypothetical protein
LGCDPSRPEAEDATQVDQQNIRNISQQGVEMMKQPNIQTHVAIDPLALLLPEDVYVKVVDWLHPREPLTKALERAVTLMTPSEKEYTLNRVNQMKEYIEVVEKAVRHTIA